ncbi:hypothetical protein, partial [Amycolatopsis sp. CFH S0740]|uniref:hypothetical protein n=1 Tax=Amycolatopsis sp. CFH S0740 TaxID=1644111 RepID=UPI0035124410
QVTAGGSVFDQDRLARVIVDGKGVAVPFDVVRRRWAYPFAPGQFVRRRHGSFTAASGAVPAVAFRRLARGAGRAGCARPVGAKSAAAEVGPGFLQAIGSTDPPETTADGDSVTVSEAISVEADAPRVRLRIGATSARRLVKIVRTEFEANGTPGRENRQRTREFQNADATLAA